MTFRIFFFLVTENQIRGRFPSKVQIFTRPQYFADSGLSDSVNSFIKYQSRATLEIMSLS